MKEIILKILTPLFYKRVTKIGKWMIVIVAISLALHYWEVLDLTKCKWPPLIALLWIYLIINAVAASPFIYLEQKSRKAVKKLCPKCGEQLEEIIEYKCEKCGKLKFEKNDSLNSNEH